MLESYKWDGLDGMGWKSLKALILRAPLCGANKHIVSLTLLFYFNCVIVIVSFNFTQRRMTLPPSQINGHTEHTAAWV